MADDTACSNFVPHPIFAFNRCNNCSKPKKAHIPRVVLRESLEEEPKTCSRHPLDGSDDGTEHARVAHRTSVGNEKPVDHETAGKTPDTIFQADPTSLMEILSEPVDVPTDTGGLSTTPSLEGDVRRFSIQPNSQPLDSAPDAPEPKVLSAESSNRQARVMLEGATQTVDYSPKVRDASAQAEPISVADNAEQTAPSTVACTSSLTQTKCCSVHRDENCTQTENAAESRGVEIQTDSREDDNAERVEAMEAELADLRSSLQQSVSTMVEFEGVIEQRNIEIERLESNACDMETENHDLKERMAEMEEELVTYREAAAQVKEFEQLFAEQEAVLAENMELKARVEAVGAREAELEAQVARMMAELEEMRQRALAPTPLTDEATSASEIESRRGSGSTKRSSSEMEPNSANKKARRAPLHEVNANTPLDDGVPKAKKTRKLFKAPPTQLVADI